MALKVQQPQAGDVSQRLDLVGAADPALAQPAFDVVEVRAQVDVRTVVPVGAVGLQTFVHGAPLVADAAVDELADEVGVPVVAGVLLDHVVVDPAQRARLAAPDTGVVERRGRPRRGDRLRIPPATRPDRLPSRRRRAAPSRCPRSSRSYQMYGVSGSRVAARDGTSCARPRPCAARVRAATASTSGSVAVCGRRRRGLRT